MKIMESMDYIAKLSVVVFMGSLPMLCYSSNNSDYFDNLPENAIINIDRLYSDYTRITLDLLNGQSDTIWIEAKNDSYIYYDDDRRETITINTIKSPQIDTESPNYTIKKVEGGMQIIVNDANYPSDAISKGKYGKIPAACIVEKDGSLSNITIKESIWPSIEKEAYRILSQTKLIPCKIGNKTFRCHHKIALYFKINKDLDDKKKDKGIVYVVTDATNLPNGVAKRFRHSITKSERELITSQGRVTTGSVRSSWNISLEIDIPEDNPNLEQLLCQTLFNKGGKSIEDIGRKFAESFEGKIKNKEFTKKDGNDLSITAHVLGFKTNKYYSYAYTIELLDKNSYTTELDENSISHNILYDIQENRILSVTDILTQPYLDNLIPNMEIPDLKTLDIGMNDFFLYIGRKEETIATISLCQENWDKFTPTMQQILGNKTILPFSLNENEFEYTQEYDYVNEFVNSGNGETKVRRIRTNYRIHREGVQPVGIKKRIVRKPNIGSKESLFHEYLTEIWKKNAIQPDSDGFVANISFILNKDQTISHYQTKLKKGDEYFYQKFIKLISNSPKWKSMLFAIDGPAKNYFNYDIEYGGKVYEYVDKMPEYSGGYRALFQWISNEITIPDHVPADALNGRIFASCIIEEDGSISEVEVRTPIDDSLKEEIKRVLRNMPKWNPGKRYGKEVRVKTSIPLKINLVR